MSNFVRPRPLADPDFRLIVFHHAAGSSSTYFGLGRHMPPGCELLLLDLPGRGKRHRDAPCNTMQDIVTSTLGDIEPFLDRPLALFGHSLGAVIAFEVAHALQARGLAPFWLGVSGRQGPGLITPQRKIQELSDQGLLDELAGLGGMPARFLDAPDFLDIILRNARADFSAIDYYRAAPGRPQLDLPVIGYAGDEDPWAPPSVMQCWADETSHSFTLRRYHGGHFYFMGPALAALAGDIARDMDTVGSGTQWAANRPGVAHGSYR